MLDARSPLAVEIMDANPHAYEALVVGGDTPALARELLGAVRPEQLLSGPAASPVAGFAMLAGLWLWHDGLDECHRIVKESPANDAAANDAAANDAAGTFSFWHAIMHRREGDFSNSKYWYARAPGHPVLAILAAQAGALVNQAPSDKQLLRLIASGWNPNAFVDLIESVRENETDPREPLAVQLQRLEWTALWAYCARP
ncbi:MAG TPA: hypothetical protein VHX86_17090 [Tepidisphaeraceae bacterium]|jgi:hypothetical protein|nr:hypothetical protein [Tepidisphaeraceae bacterium]